MPQARVGIYFAIKNIVGKKRKILLSPYTIHDVVNMVLCAGGIPEFIELENGTCNLDPNKAIEQIDEETAAVMVTHLHGLGVDLNKLKTICCSKGITLIEDAAQAFGTIVNGSHVGTIGDIGIYSFGMYKNLNSFQGGMLVTKHKEIYEKIKNDIRDLPVLDNFSYLKKVLNAFVTDIVTFPLVFKHFTYKIFRFGHLKRVEFLNKRVRVEDNPRKKENIPNSYLKGMNNIQAEIILNNLKYVRNNNKKRIDFAKLYFNKLKKIPHIQIAPFHQDFEHTYSYYTIQYDKRDDLVDYLMFNGCDLAIQHIKNCADLECFKEYSKILPIARSAAKKTILLPCYSRYSETDIKRNVFYIEKYFKEH